mmetsp:Transcript_2855/g.6241  ORF Transcript_2855/g.6241 Transcript_2855/m.6241 type:complete len:1509 (+) Transcript_2855:1-4527(+)
MYPPSAISFLCISLAQGAFTGVPVLQYPKICQENTSFGGDPLPTRYFSNDCRVDVPFNATRRVDHDLNIVVMAPGVGAIGDILTQSEPYIAMALQDVENSALLPGFRLNAYVAESRCSAPDATANTIRSMSTGPPKHGILGDGCSGACVAVNDAIQYFNVLQVSHTCASVSLSNLNRHPFFTRMAPNFKNSVVTIRQVIMQFGWERIGLIIGWRGINTLGRDIFLELAEQDVAAGRYNWKILMVASAADKQLATQAIAEAKVRDARIVCNGLYEDMGAFLMCEAFKQGMFSPRWMQLSISGWWASGFLSVLQTETDCTMDQLYMAGFGWLMANPHGGYVASEELHGLSHRRVSDIYAQYRSECGLFFGSDLGCNDGHPPYMYDGIWHFALLLHKYLILEGHSYDELNTPESRERLFNLSLEVDFLGITGRVRQYNFIEPTTTDYEGSIGDREGPNGIRQLTGPPNDALKAVGYRLPNNTLVWVADVVWSTDGTKRVPCASGTCDLESGWLPAESAPEDCPNSTVWISETGCTNCSAGFFADGEQCVPCGGGTANSDPGQVECTPCAAGRFSKLLGSIACEECPTGRFSDVEGASECVQCAQGGFENETGSSACTPCGGVLVTLRGATSRDECVCPVGSYRPLHSAIGDCAPCGEGVACEFGTDLNDYDYWPTILEGYYADLSLSVFKCLDDGRRCRLGKPGESCADGRRGRVCAECEDGKAPSTDGSCKECNAGADTLPLVLLIVAAVLLLAGAYYVFDSSDFTKQSHHTLLIAMALSLLITMMQQLGALIVVSIAWPAPMRALFRILNVLAFDMEALKVDCVVQPRPAISFAMKVLMFAACVVVIFLIHILSVLIRRAGAFRDRNHTLVSSIGTVFLVFYVSVFISILAPLQCARNPNGLWTLKPYPSVICWDGSQEHQAMLVLGAFAAFVPIGFLGQCCRVIWVLPHKMSDGDVNFLRSYAFLFFRYKPAMYWYSLFHLGRSLAVALTTIMPVAGVQVLLLQVVLILQLALVCVRQPWRVPEANALEAVLTLGVVLMLCCAALITGGGSSEDVALAWTFIALLIVALIAVFVMAIYAVYWLLVHRRRKPFDFFICHHKARAGCMARLINVEFAVRGRKAFIDTDDLRDLDKLFDYVATQTQTLLILCSKLIFTRPWCMGEVVTANYGQVQIAKVITRDFHEPDEPFIENYLDVVGGDLSCLTECGIDLPQIQDTLRKVSKISGCTLPKTLSPGTMHLLCTTLSKREVTEISYVAGKEMQHATVVLIADLNNSESACTSFILVDLLTIHIRSADVSKVPMVLTQDLETPPQTAIFLLICSSGALSQQPVVSLLHRMCKKAVQGLPIVQDEHFNFPDAHYFETDSHVSLLELVCDKDEEVDELAAFILGVFKVIATLFQPSHYGSTKDVLDSKVKDLAHRIHKGTHTSYIFSGGADRVGSKPSKTPSITPREIGKSGGSDPPTSDTAIVLNPDEASSDTAIVFNPDEDDHDSTSQQVSPTMEEDVYEL